MWSVRVHLGCKSDYQTVRRIGDKMDKHIRKELWMSGKLIENESISKQSFTYQCACCSQTRKLKFIEALDEILCLKCCMNQPICETLGCTHLVVKIFNNKRDTKCRQCALGDIMKAPMNISIMRSPMGDFVSDKMDFNGREEIYKKVSKYKDRNDRDWHKQLTASANEAKYLKAKRLRKLEREAEELSRGIS